MYHLLAAIIAVVLGVYMAAAGIIYTGSAFSGASAKAQAIQIVSSMEQIDAAWSMWEAAGGNAKTAGSGANVKAALIANSTYLAQYPAPPAVTAGTTVTAPVYAGAYSGQYYIDANTDNTVNQLANMVVGGAQESLNDGVYAVLDATLGGNTCLAISQSAGLIAPSKTLTSANLALPSGCTVSLNTNSGIVSKADVDCLNANYKYWCVPLTAAYTAIPVLLGAKAPTAGGTNDDAVYLAFFKHL